MYTNSPLYPPFTLPPTKSPDTRNWYFLMVSPSRNWIYFILNNISSSSILYILSNFFKNIYLHFIILPFLPPCQPGFFDLLNVSLSVQFVTLIMAPKSKLVVHRHSGEGKLNILKRQRQS